MKKHAQHSKQRKVQFLMPVFVAHFVAQTVNTICFEGFAHVHLNGFGVALGCQLGSLFDTFKLQGSIVASKMDTQNADVKTVENRIYRPTE